MAIQSFSKNCRFSKNIWKNFPTISSNQKGNNYVKAEFYKKLLENFGAEVLLINNRENKLPLSQMAAIANQSNVDFIQSIGRLPKKLEFTILPPT